jgi:c-di-GMP-binding flagellar brake protein YcgR
VENPFYQKPQRGMREPRANIRTEIQAVIRYNAPSGGKEIQAQAFIADISEKGILLSTPKEVIPLETEVRATFHLPGLGNETPINIAGRVVRTKSLEGGRCGTGIEFKEVSETNLKSIRSFIALNQLGETF